MRFTKQAMEFKNRTGTYRHLGVSREQTERNRVSADLNMEQTVIFSQSSIILILYISIFLTQEKIKNTDLYPTND